MAKFIIGIDAFSDPDNLEEKEFVTHTEFPRFIAEIFFVESDGIFGFALDTINIIWNEPCDKNVLDAAVTAAGKAIEFYTEKTMTLEN